MRKNKRALFVMLLLAVLAGCKHKDHAAPPPQAQAPTVAPETQPATPPPAEPATPPAETPPPQPETTPPAETRGTETKPATPKPHPKRSASHKPASQPAQKPASNAQEPASQSPVQQASNQPHPGTGAAAQPAGGSAAPEAATPSPAPPIPDEQTLHARGTTDQLLQATEGNLRRLNRTLNPAEQKIVDEIKNYMQRSRSAQSDGDLNLARNYALKAHQLSDALVTQ